MASNMNKENIKMLEEVFRSAFEDNLMNEQIVHFKSKFRIQDMAIVGCYPETRLEVTFTTRPSTGQKYGARVPIWEPGEDPFTFNPKQDATDAALRWDEGFATGELPIIDTPTDDVVWFNLWEDWS